MSDEEIGQRLLDTIIEGGLIHADEVRPDVLVWSANAAEQIGALARELIEELAE